MGGCQTEVVTGRDTIQCIMKPVFLFLPFALFSLQFATVGRTGPSAAPATLTSQPGATPVPELTAAACNDATECLVRHIQEEVN